MTTRFANSLSRRDALRLLSAPAMPQLPARRPNLLMLYADDMGWSDVGFNGRREWTTPNLDRLASQGTRFTRWYTGAPLCAPSRACLLTGRYTIHHGVKNNSTDIPKSEVTIAEALKPHGYATALFGKWHRGRLRDGSFTHPLDQGFDQTYGYLDAKHAWEHFPQRLWRGREDVPASGYSADIFADAAIQFFRDHRSQPFYVQLSFIEPHFLIESPPEDLARYRGKFQEKDAAKPYNAHYAGMIHRLDSAVGRVLKALDETGLAGETLVVFSSDNGATFEAGNQGTAWYHDSNRPYRGQKRSLEEGGIRVPGIVRWPGQVPAGRVADYPVHMIDIMPSFLAAAGVAADPAWKLDGANLLEVWRGKAQPPNRALFWEFNTENIQMYAAMRGDLKLLEIGGNPFLYNVREDPGERRTLAGEAPDVLKQLRAELSDWRATEIPR
jgi:arylsulfatase A-like enzyme